MTRVPITLICASLALAGCDKIFGGDPRKGAETVAECVARLSTDINLLEFRKLADAPGQLVPTYTFDITKLPFSAKQELIQPGADETLGSRLMARTNEASTALDLFMNTPVDEKGAFFFVEEPALWRVRGEPAAYDDVLVAGCERQIDDMRLVRVSAERANARSANNATNTAPPSGEQRSETTQ